MSIPPTLPRRRKTTGRSASPVLRVSYLLTIAGSAFARIENHFFINDGWMRDGQLLEKQEIDKMYA